MSRARAILGFREVETPTRKVAFEEVVLELRRCADAVYALGQYLDRVQEEVGSSTAIVLSVAVRERCEALQALVEQKDGEGRADG